MQHLQWVPQGGQPDGQLHPPANDTIGWSTEESLDVETVHSVCQNCKILLVEAKAKPSPIWPPGNEAVKLKADEISNSYGFPESQVTVSEASAYNHPGTVITASSGDNGYFAFDHLGETADKPSIPASLNTVVAVGGTSLYLGQTAARQSETVWNDNGTKDYWEQNFEQPLGAAGGGCSTLIGAKLANEPRCGPARTAAPTGLADVSAVADYLTGFDVYDSYNCGMQPATGWSTVGGTSLSSPIIASMFGLAGGAHGVNYPALTLYGHRSPAHDVTSGGNGCCDGEGAASAATPTSGFRHARLRLYSQRNRAEGDRACDALTGYDGPSGVGTPNGSTMFDKTGPSVAIAGPGTATVGHSVKFTAKVTDPFPGGFANHYVWHWGDGTSSTTTPTPHLTPTRPPAPTPSRSPSPTTISAPAPRPTRSRSPVARRPLIQRPEPAPGSGRCRAWAASASRAPRHSRRAQPGL